MNVAPTMLGRMRRLWLLAAALLGFAGPAAAQTAGLAPEPTYTVVQSSLGLYSSGHL